MKKNKILIIGAGAAGSVVVKKCLSQPDTFHEIHLASRTIEKCKTLQKSASRPLHIHQIDADKTEEVISLIKKTEPDLVINMALPYQDLSIMNACIQTKTHYLDTANYENPKKEGFCYKEQWALNDAFEKNDIFALLGSGFDPGVTNVFCAYANQTLFEEIHTIDIVDCNAGDHGHPFATNFNPEINIREITQPGKYWENGKWIETPPLQEAQEFDFPEVGPRKAYLMYHEELESLAQNIPHLKRIRFWMTFSESYLTHLKVLQNVGMTNIHPIEYEGQKIIPLQFLKTLLPKPSDLGENYSGKTSIGCIITGIKDGKEKKVMVYNVCDHQECFKETGAQAVSYTTGVPAMIGAKLILEKKWIGKGVYNMEQLNPTPFMEELNKNGLPWKVKEL